MDIKSLKESDLYQPIRTYLEGQGFTVKGEVQHCDVTALKDDNIVVVELKKYLNLDVILQATQRQRIADYVYIAVPKKLKAMRTARWRQICHLLRRLEIGLLLVAINGDSHRVELLIEPQPFNRKISRSRKSIQRAGLVREFNNRQGDYNTGGVTRKKVVTAYREMAIHIAVLLSKHGSLSPKQLRELGTDSNKTSSILQKNFYGWFERESKGLYKLSSLGARDLEKYKAIAELYGYQGP